MKETTKTKIKLSRRSFLKSILSGIAIVSTAPMSNHIKTSTIKNTGIKRAKFFKQADHLAG